MNEFVTGVMYDRLNQAKAERQLQYVQEKLRRDAEAGNSAAVDHDARRIDNLRYRIVVDTWLIRKNSLCDPGPYPFRSNELTCAAIAQASSPAEIPYLPQTFPPPMVPVPTIAITIVNTVPTGPGIAFDVNGLTYQSPAGSRQDLSVTVDAKINYDSGGSLGQQRYQLAPGLYEFRSTPEGWALYKMPNKP